MDLNPKLLPHYINYSPLDIYIDIFPFIFHLKRKDSIYLYGKVYTYVCPSFDYNFNTKNQLPLLGYP